MGQLTLDWPVIVAVITALTGFIGGLLVEVRRQMESRITDLRDDRNLYRAIALRSVRQAGEALTIGELMEGQNRRSGP